MSNQLFAFNVAQDLPTAEVVAGRYDPQQQLWVGEEGVSLAGCYSFWCHSLYCSYFRAAVNGIDCLVDDNKVDGDCD